MILYAITSRCLLGETEQERAEKLVALAAHWAANGVDYIQIREDDLSSEELVSLAKRIVAAVRRSGEAPKVLINASLETADAIALASGADGVHLRSGFTPNQLAATVAEANEAWKVRRDATPPVSVSCHSVADVQAARAAGATLALFAPVFEKVLPDGETLAGKGLAALAEACRAVREPASEPELPVLALGGVTLENAQRCIGAGAAGIAAIRLFSMEGPRSAAAWQHLSRHSPLPEQPK